MKRIDWGFDKSLVPIYGKIDAPYVSLWMAVIGQALCDLENPNEEIKDDATRYFSSGRYLLDLAKIGLDIDILTEPLETVYNIKVNPCAIDYVRTRLSLMHYTEHGTLQTPYESQDTVVAAHSTSVEKIWSCFTVSLYPDSTADCM